MTADPVVSMLFGLAFDGGPGGTALFDLPINMEDLIPCFFVLGSPFGGGGACFFAELQLLFTAAAEA